MNKLHKKIVLIGCGAVGTSFLYSSVNQGIAEEYILIDAFPAAAEGNAMDIDDMRAILDQSFLSIKAGDYSDCKDADLIVITAGRPQKPGETRLDMVADNAKIMKSIAENVKSSGFKGITLIAANPVDILTMVFHEVTKFPAQRVISSGTTLDSSRLRRLLADKIGVAPKSVSAYLFGEHGDSSVAVWSQANVFGKPIQEYLDEKVITQKDLNEIREEAVNMAYKIIELKKATFYGIGGCLAKLSKAILRNEQSVNMVGAKLSGEYSNKDVYAGVPVVLGSNGIEKIVTMKLTKEEQDQFNISCEKIAEVQKVALSAIK